MRKRVWIWNHYAGDTFFSEGGRHYWFAKYLKSAGYEPVIFCSNAKHNSAEPFYFQLDGIWEEKRQEKINTPYIFVKSRAYAGNGKERILNMKDFYVNVQKTAREYAAKKGKPDIIIASSVHPLTLVAGEKLAKKFGVPCICEVRDLWPETLVAFGMLKKDALLTKALYAEEKRIYKKANSLIDTDPYGKKYIKDKGWQDEIDLEKVYYISNGVDIEQFNNNKKLCSFADIDLDSNKFKVIYTGSMGKPNQIDKIIDAAEKLKENKEIIFLLYGDGALRSNMEERCREQNISNVIFKGVVEKKKVPYILAKGDVNIFTILENNLYKYGISPNKLFEYLASGKPIVCNSEYIYSVLGDKKCGVVNADLAKGILEIYNSSEDEYKEMCANSYSVAQNFGFDKLAEKLIEIIENC